MQVSVTIIKNDYRSIWDQNHAYKM